MTTQTDRTSGLIGNLGMKAPVRAITNGPIVLSGLQTVNGVVLAAADRVLVNNQVDTTTNGIYDVDSAAWSRSRDCDSAYDLVKGSTVNVIEGAATGLYQCTSANPITIGSSFMTWAVLAGTSTVNNPVTLAQGGTGATNAVSSLAALGLVQCTAPGGTANAQTAAVDALCTAFRTAQLFIYTPSIGNTAAATLTLTPAGAAALAAKNIYMGGLPLAGGELVQGVPVLLEYDGAVLNMLGRAPALAAATLLQNVGLSVTAAGNALTIALKDQAGNDPSPTSPVSIAFRNTSLPNGAVTTLTITAASSLVLSAGSSLGMTNNQPHRIYVMGINDNGVFRMGIWNPLDTANAIIRGLEEYSLYSAVNEGGGTATLVHTLYSTAATAPRAVRILGYIEIVEVTAGVYASQPTKVQLMGLGVHRTGELVQKIRTGNANVGSFVGAAVTPLTDAVPLYASGNNVISTTVTPTSLYNLMHWHARVQVAHSAGTECVVAMHKDAAAAMRSAFDVIAVNPRGIDIDHLEYVSGLVAQNVEIHVGSPTAGNLTVNGTAGGRLGGGTLYTYLDSEEIFI